METTTSKEGPSINPLETGNDHDDFRSHLSLITSTSNKEEAFQNCWKKITVSSLLHASITCMACLWCAQLFSYMSPDVKRNHEYEAHHEYETHGWLIDE